MMSINAAWISKNSCFPGRVFCQSPLNRFHEIHIRFESKRLLGLVAEDVVDSRFHSVTFLLQRQRNEAEIVVTRFGVKVCLRWTPIECWFGSL